MGGSELIGQKEKEAICEVIDRAGVLLRYGFDAPRKNIFKVKEFEEAFAGYAGTKHALAVSSGTAALRVALAALGVGPGDEVIIPSFTFVATMEAVLESRAAPVIAEVDNSLNLDPSDVEKRITDRTRLIIPVHMLGVPARMDELMKVASEGGVTVLEDSAQACGSSYKGRKTGTIAKMGCFSFDYVKTITTGEGGMVVTDDTGLYERASWYHDHGHQHLTDRPRGEDTAGCPGFNYRMNDIQGALGLVQLGRLDEVLAAQRENKRRVKEALQGEKGIEFRDLPDAGGDGGDTLAFFLEDEKTAARFEKSLTEQGVGTKILPSALGWHFAGNWPHLLAEMKSRGLPVPAEGWPRTEKLLKRAIAVAISVKMDDSQIGKLAGALKKAAIHNG